VAAYCGTQEVALYGAAARLLALVVMPMLIGNAILQPLIADVHGRGDQLLMQRLGSITATISSGIAVVALAAIWMAAGSILAVAYGDYYREAADILIVLCAGQTLNVLAGPGAVVLMMSGGQKDVMAVSLGCCALIAVGAVIAATAYGSLGIACVAAAGTALHGMLCLILVRRRHGIWINASLVGLKRTYQTMRNLRTCRQVS
jgi:O-antigen/teichoic acid export membrane protein